MAWQIRTILDRLFCLLFVTSFISHVARDQHFVEFRTIFEPYRDGKHLDTVRSCCRLAGTLGQLAKSLHVGAISRKRVVFRRPTKLPLAIAGFELATWATAPSSTQFRSDRCRAPWSTMTKKQPRLQKGPIHQQTPPRPAHVRFRSQTGRKQQHRFQNVAQYRGRKRVALLFRGLVCSGTWSRNPFMSEQSPANGSYFVDVSHQTSPCDCWIRTRDLGNRSQFNPIPLRSVPWSTMTKKQPRLQKGPIHQQTPPRPAHVHRQKEQA